MFSLPRGTGASQNVPLASAVWENARTIERYFYKDNGYLFLGASPGADRLPLIKALLDRGKQAIGLITDSALHPLERHKRIEAIKSAFAKVLAVCSIPIGLNDDRHFITVAGSRSGKGTSAIIPNLCLYKGSVICLDPKGENAMITAERRGKGNSFCKGLEQKIFVIDPFGITKGLPDEMRASFNPLSLLYADSDSVVEDAALMAEALVVSTDDKAAHWDESARNIITGIILHLITKCRWRKPNLLTLRQFLTIGDLDGYNRYIQYLTHLKEKLEAEAAEKGEEPPENPLNKAPKDPFIYLLQRMDSNTALNGIIKAAANTLMRCGHKDFIKFLQAYY